MARLGSLFNMLMDGSKPLEPEVGMGCTILYWTDRSAATIMKVSDNKKHIWISMDRAIRVDKNGMSEDQSYIYETRNIDVPEAWVEYTLRKNGRYYKKGDTMRSNPSLLIGVRREYYDYSF